MKKKIVIALLALILSASMSLAQDGVSKLPSVNVKTLDGKMFNTKDIANDGKPIIISFWATWCKPCIKELTSIAEVYGDWQTETGVKLIAVSIDDSRTSTSVKPTVDSKQWEYLVLIDQNSDLKRALSVNQIPHTFVINGNGEIVWQHTSFTEGGELQLIEIVRKVAKGEKITD